MSLRHGRSSTRSSAESCWWASGQASRSENLWRRSPNQLLPRSRGHSRRRVRTHCSTQAQQPDLSAASFAPPGSLSLLKKKIGPKADSPSAQPPATIFDAPAQHHQVLPPTAPTAAHRYRPCGANRAPLQPSPPPVTKSKPAVPQKDRFQVELPPNHAPPRCQSVHIPAATLRPLMRPLSRTLS